MENKIIVLAYVGTGKTEITKRYEGVWNPSSDSYRYVWDRDIPLEQRKGSLNRIENPAFPKNYIDAISKNIKANIVLLPLTEKLFPLYESKDFKDKIKGARMILACPPKDGFDGYEMRYKERGNSQTFIENRRKEFPFIIDKFGNAKGYEKVTVHQYLDDALINHGIKLEPKKIDKIDAVILDMDGTIFDTERLGIEKWIQAFKEFGIPAPVETLYEKIGLSGKDSRRFMQKESDIEFDYDIIKKRKQQLIKEYIAKYGTPIKKGFEELVGFLNSKKINVAIATSRTRDGTMHYIQHAGKDVDKKFNVIVTGDMIENGKPSPDIFLHTAKMLGVLPEHCLVIEDSINGIKAAVAAKMRVIMIPDLIEPSEEIKQLNFSVKRSLLDVIDFICSANSMDKASS